MVRHPSPDHLTELETCVKILKHLSAAERPAMLDRINHKIACLSQDPPPPNLSGSQRQQSQTRSNNDEQQQLSTIERLVSARVEIEGYGGDMPDMQPLIKKHMDALRKAWPVTARNAEGKHELEAFFKKLRRNENRHHSRGLDAAVASMRATQRDEEQEQSGEVETMLARMREAQRHENQHQSRELDDFFTRLRLAQREEDQHQSRELETFVARMRAAGHFAELGLFTKTNATSSTSSQPTITSPKQRSCPLTFVKIGPRDTDAYFTCREQQYHLLFDAEANSYTVQEVREVASSSVQRSDKVSFHVNAVQWIDAEGIDRMGLRINVVLQSGKEVYLVFVSEENSSEFVMNVYRHF